jgi:DHA1 family bicyclomycin/chloramphenicol resistance-like MFS transporter
LFVFALSQLAYGPLSDRFGRKPPIMIGLLIYLVGSLGCAFAWTAPLLIGARIVQALGAAAGPALGRAVLRDFYSGIKLTSSLSTIGAAVALSPMLGPVLGGYLQVAFGWRTSFFFLSVCGALLVAGVFFRLPESSAHIDKQVLSAGVILDHYRSLLTDREYVSALLCGGLLTAGNFAWTAGAPFLFASTYHFTADRYGNIALIIGAGYVLGTFVSGFLSRRLLAPTVVYSGMLLAVAASIALSWLARGESSYVPIVVTMFIFTMGMGVVIPLSAACALSRHPEIAGAAAGLLGALQILTGALGTVAISSVTSVSVTPIANILIVTVIVASVAAYVSLLSFRRQTVSTKERLA